MAQAFNKFNQFVDDLAGGIHDFDSDTFKVMLSNTLPVATTPVKADITEISAGNGYTAGGQDAGVSYSETLGTATITSNNVIWTASGGAIAQFQYVVLYNDTPASPLDPLIGWWTASAAVDLVATETFTFSPQAGELFTIS